MFVLICGVHYSYSHLSSVIQPQVQRTTIVSTTPFFSSVSTVGDSCASGIQTFALEAGVSTLLITGAELFRRVGRITVMA